MLTTDSTITNKKGWLFSGLIVMIVIFMAIPNHSYAQDDDISLDLVLRPQLTRAQVLSLSNLGINKRGHGAPLFNLVIRNNENEPQNDLYLDIQIRSNKVGLIADLYQESGRPFSLRSRQVVTANNNQLQNGLPGVREDFGFNGGLTDGGEEFINSLGGSTRLPADIYTVVLSIYQGNNSRNGGVLVATVEQTLGENISTDTSIDLYLLQPGGELGSEETINTTLPVFRWDGPPNLNYRLIVVEDNGQSPEALIQAATSTDPVINRGTSGQSQGNSGNGSGSLVEFEMVDAIVKNFTFTMPPSGLQTLEPGNRYYWQVFANSETVNGTESVPSEIWEFSIASDARDVEAGLNQRVHNALEGLLGASRYQELQDNGYNFDSITIDGQTLRGVAAYQRLRNLSTRLNNGDITLVIN